MRKLISPGVTFALTVALALSGVASEQPGAAEKRLRQRVTEFWQAVMERRYDDAAAYVNEDDRATFIALKKYQVRDFEIIAVEMGHDEKSAMVWLKVKRPAPPIPDLIDWEIKNLWVYAAGDWYFKLDRDAGKNPFVELFTGSAQSTTVPSGNLKTADHQVKFDSVVKDFGKLLLGRRVSHRFEFANLADQPVQVVALEVLSPAVHAAARPETVMPGAKGAIEVELDTYALPAGEFRHEVVVRFSGAREPFGLKLNAQLLPGIAIEPRRLIMEAEASEAVIGLRNNSEAPVKILSVAKNSDKFDLLLDKQELGPGEEAKLVAKASGPREKQVFDLILIRTDDPYDDVIAVPFEMKAVRLGPGFLKTPAAVKPQQGEN